MDNKEQTPSINQEAAITPKKYYNEKIKFIEKHWAFISSLLVALIVFINFLFKVFEFSKAEAMYIDRSWIDFDSQYVIYSLMKSCLFIFAFATYNYLIYNVITKKNKKARTIALIIPITVQSYDKVQSNIETAKAEYFHWNKNKNTLTFMAYDDGSSFMPTVYPATDLIIVDGFQLDFNRLLHKIEGNEKLSSSEKDLIDTIAAYEPDCLAYQQIRTEDSVAHRKFRQM